MIFQKMELCEHLITGQDELNNPLYELASFLKTEGRFSNWSEKEIALDTRNITQNQRKIITSASLADCEKAVSVLFDGKYYTIHERTDVGRWRILVVDHYGS